MVKKHQKSLLGFDPRLSIKKSLFPVQRVAKIVASRAAQFFVPIFWQGRGGEGKNCQVFWRGRGNEGEKKGNPKKSLQSHLFQLPGRHTGIIIIFMGSPMLSDSVTLSPIPKHVTSRPPPPSPTQRVIKGRMCDALS